ncbi:MAG TPA: hypothetical protein VH593_25585 [Ktedonobacteraceae bacterium]
MQRRTQEQLTMQTQSLFTASEVAEYEYCPLVWWYEHFDPAAAADDDLLFAEMVAIENKDSEQAPSLPKYQMLERLLARRGAFDEGQQQHKEHAEAVEEAEEIARDRLAASEHGARIRGVFVFVVVLLLLALLMIGAWLYLTHLS